MDLLTPSQLTTNTDRYNVFSDKDMRYDGHLFLGVTSTGIFCRPGCPARLPKFENCTFHNSAAEALSSGFRACKRCHPAGGDKQLIKTLISLVESKPDLKITNAALNEYGVDPSTARRQFLGRFGMSFIEYARARRLALAAKTLATGGTVLDAQLDAGFESASGFRSAYAKVFGKVELEAYFAGHLTHFETPLATSGTEFQRQTWNALQTIPHGETRSYAQLAEMIGKPAAIRAVASANANNGLALIIPCHRVIAKNGGLGGYAGGLTRKQQLLDLESSNRTSKEA